MLQTFYADLHIHIGRTEEGDAVKISGSEQLTFFNIAKEASERKGVDMIGIIDCHSPAVQREIERYIENGQMEEIEGGGIRYGKTTIILGSEIEVRDAHMGPAHVLAYFPTLEVMKQFTTWMSGHMKNVGLSSQRIYVPARELQHEIIARGGIIIPAHVFTPHRSVYGSCSNRIAHLLDLEHIAAIELGLSADTEMASYLSELDPFTFLTNSDAHSLPKIGREYNRLILERCNYTELVKALERREGRHVAANFGLNPRLGKYHRTFCNQCDSILDEQHIAVTRCLYCGSEKITRGVIDRIIEIADREQPVIATHRPPYHYQVPLEFIPGLGPKKRVQLLARFGTEMVVLHRSTYAELAEVVGELIARLIVDAREGTLSLEAGGGGQYGRVNSIK